MMDVDDDRFKIYTASRLNKARGLTKGRAAPCNWLLSEKMLALKLIVHSLLNIFTQHLFLLNLAFLHLLTFFLKPISPSSLLSVPHS